ncbi:MAG: glycosyl hydrolase family 28-related protein, partial [Bacteroidota bacterium]
MNRFSAFLLLLLPWHALSGQSALWDDYVSARQNNTHSILRDYSHAGYHKSEVGLPKVDASTHSVFNVTDFGAVPNDGLSDRQAIVDAIEAASNNTPAIVYIPEGRFRINEPSDIGQPDIVIRSDSVVLMGAGIAKTELYMDQALLDEKSGVIFFASKRHERYYFHSSSAVRAVVTQAPAHHGTFSLEVDQTDSLEVGDVVFITADLNVLTQAGRDYFLPHAVPKGVVRQHGRNNSRITELHTIVAIENNHVIFGEPIHMDLAHMENIFLREVPHFIRESGIQDMTIRANNREQFKHHAGSTFSTKFNPVRFDYAFDCWINNVRFKDFGTAVTITNSMFCTLSNMSFEGNTGHFSSKIQTSYGILSAFHRENSPCHHGYGASHSASNSVFYRGNQYLGIEAHGPFPRAALYDLNKGGFTTRGGGSPKYPSHG